METWTERKNTVTTPVALEMKIGVPWLVRFFVAFNDEWMFVQCLAEDKSF